MSYIAASRLPDGRSKIAGVDDNGREVVVILNPFDALDIGPHSLTTACADCRSARTPTPGRRVTRCADKKE